MSENPLIDEFLNYLRFERHFSPHTAKCYSADLTQFCAFLAGDLDPTTAFMMGKLKVEGDMGIAMKLSSVF